MVEKIESIALHEKARESYLNYALSVITSRALPDIRDGLKPVQRRILYAMYNNLHLTHDAKFRKSALVVGEVMGKYHPHGDQAIYDAMVRMAQSFSLRYPLVDGQGNFGSLDGDSPAAMRYTEVRLRSMSSELLAEIGKQTVEFGANYDGQYFEPIVLPAQLPNLLLNGATGIAVGMATNIPPHNLREVSRACVKLIDDPEADLDALLKYVKAPDFPTGGQINNTPEELKRIYETGQGTVKLTGTWSEEASGKKRFVVITSVPFMVNKASLVEKIAEHIEGGKVPQLLDIRDESTDEVRVVCELSPSADAETAVAYLYKHTPLRTNFHVNLTCLIPTENPQVRVPARVDLKTMLREFLDFRFEVLTRRLRFDLEKIERRIFILEAFAKIFDQLDVAIKIIRGAENKPDAREKLMAHFELALEQAEAVLETKLYKLAKLEIESIREELALKQEEAGKLRALLSSDEALWGVVKAELVALTKKYGDRRMTRIEGPSEDLEYKAKAYIVDEETHVIITREGWLKRQRSYNGLDKIRVRDTDALGWVFPATTRKAIVFFTDRGRAYTMLVDKTLSTSGYGEPIQTHFEFADGEKVVGVACTDPRCILLPAEEGEDDPAPPHFVAVTRAGNTVRFSLEAFVKPSTVSGRMFMRLQDDDDGPPDGVVGVYGTAGVEQVCLASFRGRGLVFPVDQIPLVKGRGRGVSAMKLDDGDVVLDFCLTEEKHGGLEVETTRGRREVIRPSKYASSRNNKGRAILKRGNLRRVVPPCVEVREIDEDQADGEDLPAPARVPREVDKERNAEILHQLALFAEGRPAFAPQGPAANSNNDNQATEPSDGGDDGG